VSWWPGWLAPKSDAAPGGKAASVAPSALVSPRPRDVIE
jgi:hypothetical protein